VKFERTKLPDVWIVDLEPLVDERGFFARSWCQREFAARGIEANWVQSNVALNERCGTLRGLHYQAPPHGEGKLVRVTRGAAYCVVVDVRPGSATHLQWICVELTAENRRQLWVPEGLAFGYQTLADQTELLYLMSEFYVPDAARGMRYDDPALAIRWPLAVSVISERDRLWPDVTESCLSH
jgi:dTDP-4-dehydrorhamnose 3,5-epimerase